MKKILSTVLLAVYTLLGMAAGNKANLECVYRLTYQKDTITHRSEDAMMVLRLGDSQSLFYSIHKQNLKAIPFRRERRALMSFVPLGTPSNRGMAESRRPIMS